MKTIGVHLLCELSGCNREALSSVQAVRHGLESAAEAARATVLNGYFHQFSPSGVSGVLCLAESHISIHTWPEHGYAAVDIYTCGDSTVPHNGITILAAALEAENTKIREISRGLEDKPDLFTNRDTSASSAKSGFMTAIAPNVEPSAEPESDKKSTWYIEDADPHERHLYQVSSWLVSKKSQFQQIGIVRNRSYGKILFLDGAVQSSERDEYVYHEAHIHPGMCLHPKPERVLILGGGEGASLREVLRHNTVKHATMVDIDGELVRQCRQHLPEWSAGAFEDPRARLIIADGKQWVDETHEKFDVIFMDLTDQIDLGPSFQLYTKEFYATVRSRLNPGGILLVQAGELSTCEYFSHCTIRKTLATAFPQLRTYIQHVPTFFAQWSFIVASNADVNFDASEKIIDDRIATRIKKELRFYDGKCHHRMFSLPKDIVRILDTSGTIVTSEAAFAEAYEASQMVYSD